MVAVYILVFVFWCSKAILPIGLTRIAQILYSVLFSTIAVLLKVISFYVLHEDKFWRYRFVVLRRTLRFGISVVLLVNLWMELQWFFKTDFKCDYRCDYKLKSSRKHRHFSCVCGVSTEIWALCFAGDFNQSEHKLISSVCCSHRRNIPGLTRRVCCVTSVFFPETFGAYHLYWPLQHSLCLSAERYYTQTQFLMILT